MWILLKHQGNCTQIIDAPSFATIAHFTHVVCDQKKEGSQYNANVLQLQLR